MSWAFVAVTEHNEPASPGVRVDPDTVHVPDATVHVTAPVPLPPDVVNDNACPYVAEVDVTVKVACAVRAIEMVVLEDDTSRKLVSVTLVALTTQDDPASPGVSVEPETVHVPDTFAQTSPPSPLPPVAVNARD